MSGSATLVMEMFSQQPSYHYVILGINGFSHNYFGIHPKTVVYSGENVSVFLLSYGNAFKYKANVSIINSQKDKLFTREYSGEFGNKINENNFSLMPRSEMLLPENGYLFNDKLTLLCEIEVIEDRQEIQSADESNDFSNLSKNLQSLLSDGKFADACLIVGSNGKEFNVHKNILSSRSPVFAAMFEHDCEEKRLGKVTITDMDEDVCAEMLSFVYSGKVKDLDRYAMELLVAADKYQLYPLKAICTQYMCNHLSVESVANVLILADLHQATALKAKCIGYIISNVEQVQTTDGWNILGTKAKLLQELFVYAAMKK